MKKFELDLPCALLLDVVAMVLMANLGFCLGVGVSPWLFWVVCGGVGVMMAHRDRRKYLMYALSLACIVLATSFTYSYYGTDALGCWLPMQRLMQHGWNPVWEYGLGSIRAQANGAGLSIHHILVYPKFVPIVAAVVGKGLHFFAADSFLAYVLMTVLWMTAYSFARNLWQVSTFPAHVFAAGITITSKIVGIFGGYIDYDVYAAFLIAAFALYFMRHTDDRKYWILFALSELVSFGIKGNGAINAIVLMVCGFVCLPAAKRFRMAKVSGLVLLLALFENINPIIPILDKFLFNHQQWTDITCDFTGNADALSLGYLWRIVYAWVSPSLVPGHPVFTVVGGVGGFGTAFRFLLLASLIAMLFSRRNFVLWLLVAIFVASNALPLKYIGHARYCPQMWAIPILAFFNFAFVPICRLKKYSFQSFVRWMIIGCIALSSAALLARGASKWMIFRKAEMSVRETASSMLQSKKSFALTPKFSTANESYFILERLLHEGVDVIRVDPANKRATIDYAREKYKINIHDAK